MQIILQISNRKILSGLVQAVKLADDTDLGEIELVVFRAIDDRSTGLQGVESLLGKGRTIVVETSLRVQT